MRMPHFMDRFRLRRAFQAAAQSVSPVLQPGQAEVEDNGMVASSPGAKVWQYSKARVPMPWGEDISRHNAAIEREAVLERLDLWADALQGKRQARFRPDPTTLFKGEPIEPHIAYLACLYIGIELEQGFAKRQNVTGLGPKMPRLQPDEIADARDASKLQSTIQGLERGGSQERWVTCERCGRSLPISHSAEYDLAKKGCHFEFFFCADRAACDAFKEAIAANEAELEGTILKALGGDDELLQACGGNPELVAQVKAKARSLFAAGEKKGYEQGMEDS